MEKGLTMGSLFAGIGGFELAGQWAGIQPIWSNELNNWCCKVLNKNFTHDIYEEDIRTFINRVQRNPERFKVDIITGGFPCQPFSHAGKRNGTTDDRYLWPEMLEVIKAIRPTYVIGENVAGLVSMEKGKVLDGILSDLEAEDYTTETYLIPACSVQAWHRRERIWIVAYKSSKRFQNRRRTQVGESRQISKSQRQGSPYGGLQYVPNRQGHTPLTNPNNKGLQGSEKEGNIEKSRKNGNQFVAGYDRAGWSIWDVEPSVGRVANGIPGRVDRLKGLGNAIVPQVAYALLKVIQKESRSTTNRLSKGLLKT